MRYDESPKYYWHVPTEGVIASHQLETKFVDLGTDQFRKNNPNLSSSQLRSKEEQLDSNF
jgi:hypothetical protein